MTGNYNRPSPGVERHPHAGHARTALVVLWAYFHAPRNILAEDAKGHYDIDTVNRVFGRHTIVHFNINCGHLAARNNYTELAPLTFNEKGNLTEAVGCLHTQMEAP